MIWRENKYTEAKISSQLDPNSKKRGGGGDHNFRECEIMLKKKKEKSVLL